MRKQTHVLAAAILAIFLCFALNVNATIISVTGDPSNLGTSPGIIAAPENALDDIVFNTGMQGFDEAQGVLTTAAYEIDGGGIIAAGTVVDSHMIFLNSRGGTLLEHFNVVWAFNNPIIGVMSDYRGELEAASTNELGAPGTNYTVPFSGSGPAAPFNARGLEGMGDLNFQDGYLISPDGYSLTVSMRVTEPGDWIRVVTAGSKPVPEPGTLLLLGSGILGLAGYGRKKIKKK